MYHIKDWQPLNEYPIMLGVMAKNVNSPVIKTFLIFEKGHTKDYILKVAEKEWRLTGSYLTDTENEINGFLASQNKSVLRIIHWFEINNKRFKFLLSQSSAKLFVISYNISGKSKNKPDKLWNDFDIKVLPEDFIDKSTRKQIESLGITDGNDISKFIRQFNLTLTGK